MPGGQRVGLSRNRRPSESTGRGAAWAAGAPSGTDNGETGDFGVQLAFSCPPLLLVMSGDTDKLGAKRRRSPTIESRWGRRIGALALVALAAYALLRRPSDLEVPQASPKELKIYIYEMSALAPRRPR